MDISDSMRCVVAVQIPSLLSTDDSCPPNKIYSMRLDLETNVTALPIVESRDQNSNDEVALLVEQGMNAARNGDRRFARTLLTQATELDGSCEDAWMWLASISEYPEELLVFLNKVLEINPGNVRASEWRTATHVLLSNTFLERARSSFEGGSLDLAARYADQAAVLDASSAEPWRLKAELAGDDDSRVAMWSKVIELSPDDSQAHDALAAIENARIDALLTAANLAASNGDNDDAMSLVDEYLTERSDDVFANILKARLSDEESAVAIWNRVLELDPANSEASNALVELQSSKLDAMFENARSLARDGDNAAAISVLDEIVLGYPGNVDAWMMRSHLSTDIEQKLESLKRVLEIDPDHVAARAGHEYLSSAVNPVAAVTAPEPVVEETFEQEASENADPLEAIDEVAFATDSDGSEEIVEEVYVEEYVAAEETQAVESAIEETPVHEMETVELSAPVFNETIYSPFEAKVEEPEAVVAEEMLDAEEPLTAGFDCPFCSAHNEDQAFACTECNASLSLSDIESVLNNNSVNEDVVREAVAKLEAEWNGRELNEAELTALGVGHLNLKSYDAGCKYLQEASYLNPNNVILSGQINTIMIRLDEIRRQHESQTNMPKGKTILVVDDSPTVRKLIAGKLEKSGHHVVCAVDGVDALEKMSEITPDLVLLDITMPRMDGYEVCKEIRAGRFGKELPVVMISGKDGFFDKVRGRMAGTTGYITKPFGPETLMKALETYLIPQ